MSTGNDIHGGLVSPTFVERPPFCNGPHRSNILDETPAYSLHKGLLQNNRKKTYGHLPLTQMRFNISIFFRLYLNSDVEKYQ